MDLQPIKEALGAASGAPWHPCSDEFESPDVLAEATSIALRRGGNTLWTVLIGVTEEEARRRAEEVGPGNDAGTKFAATAGNGPTAKQNAALIANAPTWLARLVAEVEALRTFAADVAETADARFCLPGGRTDNDWERLGGAAHEFAKP